MSPRRRLLLFVASVAAAAACMDVVAPRPPKADDPAAIFDEVWREYDRHYAFFASRKVDWAGVRARYRPRALAGGAALYGALCAMLDTLHDYHVVLFTNFDACGTPALRRTYSYSPVAAVNYLGASYARSASGIITYGNVGGAGYVRMARFAGEEQVAEFDAALATMPWIPALIIDMRGNLGGNSSTAEAIAGRFTDVARPYALVRYRSGPGHDDFTAPITWTLRPAGPRFTGRVVVIIDRSVGSAGEDFTMAMRTIPGVILLGDTTSGNASNPLWRELPNGWTFWVPQSVETTIDGLTPTVDGGIPPARVVRTTARDSIRGTDSLLDSAVAVLQR